MKVKLRVTISGKRYEKIFESPCISITHIRTHVGTKTVIFKINPDYIMLDQESDYIILDVMDDGRLHCKSENKADKLRAFANDINWHLQPEEY